MSYRTEFPDYDDELIVPIGWEDSSWHNDACPSIMTEYRTDKWCEIFQDYKDEDMRECPSRYALYLHDESKGGFDYEVIEGGEDFDYLLKIANEFMIKAIQEDADRAKRMAAMYEVK